MSIFMPIMTITFKACAFKLEKNQETEIFILFIFLQSMM